MINPNLASPRIVSLVGHTLWLEQLKASAIVLLWAMLATIVIAKVVGWLCGGLRVEAEIESAGLDLTEHGEAGYTLD